MRFRTSALSFGLSLILVCAAGVLAAQPCESDVIRDFDAGDLGAMFTIEGGNATAATTYDAWFQDPANHDCVPLSRLFLADAAYALAMSTGHPRPLLYCALDQLADMHQHGSVPADVDEQALMRAGWCRYRLALSHMPASVDSVAAHLNAAKRLFAIMPDLDEHVSLAPFMSAEIDLRLAQLRWLVNPKAPRAWSSDVLDQVENLFESAVARYATVPVGGGGELERLLAARRAEGTVWLARLLLLSGRDASAVDVLDGFDDLERQHLGSPHYAIELARLDELSGRADAGGFRAALAELEQRDPADAALHDALRRVRLGDDVELLGPGNVLEDIDHFLGTYLEAKLQTRIGEEATRNSRDRYEPVELLEDFQSLCRGAHYRPLLQDAIVTAAELRLDELNELSEQQREAEFLAIREDLAEHEFTDEDLVARAWRIEVIGSIVAEVVTEAELVDYWDYLIPMLQYASLADRSLAELVIGSMRGYLDEIQEEVPQLASFAEGLTFYIESYLSASREDMVEKCEAAIAAADEDRIPPSHELYWEASYLRAVCLTRIHLRDGGASGSGDRAETILKRLVAERMNVRALYTLFLLYRDDDTTEDLAREASEAVWQWTDDNDGDAYYKERTTPPSTPLTTVGVTGSPVPIDRLTMAATDLGGHRDFYLEKLADPQYLKARAFEATLDLLERCYPLPPTSRFSCVTEGEDLFGLEVDPDAPCVHDERRGDPVSEMRMQVHAPDALSVSVLFDGEPIMPDADGLYVVADIPLYSAHDIEVRCDGYDPRIFEQHVFRNMPLEPRFRQVYPARTLAFGEGREGSLDGRLHAGPGGNLMAVPAGSPIPSGLFDDGDRRTCRDMAPFGNNRFLVTNAAAGRVDLVQANGARSVWLDAGAAGRFDSPEGIAVDREGRIYVVDAGNHRIEIFKPDGSHDATSTADLLHPTRIDVLQEATHREGDCFWPPVRLVVVDWNGVHLLDEKGGFLGTIAGADQVGYRPGEAAPVVVEGYGPGAEIVVGSQTGASARVFRARAAE